MQTELNEQTDQLFQQATETLNDEVRAYVYQAWVGQHCCRDAIKMLTTLSTRPKPDMEIDAQLNNEIKQAQAQ